MLVTRYEFGERKSSGQIIGFSRQLTSTSTVWSADADALRLRLDDEALVLERRTVGHSDFFDAGGDFYPGLRETVTRWQISDGKLEAEDTRNVSWRVDPQTGELSERAENPVPDPDREIIRLPRE